MQGLDRVAPEGPEEIRPYLQAHLPMHSSWRPVVVVDRSKHGGMREDGGTLHSSSTEEGSVHWVG